MTDCAAIEVLHSPVGGAAVVAGAGLALVALLIWAQRRAGEGRSMLILAASAMGVCVGGLNLVLGPAGVWQSCTYRLSPVVLAALYVLLPTVLAALLLIGNAGWLDAHGARHSST